MIDTLTQLPNLQQLELDLQSMQHPKLFLLDIVDFRKINLEYSDNAGDTILQKFAQSLQDFSNIHSMTCYRAIDDKFVLLKNIPFELQMLENLIRSIIQFIKNQSYYYEDNEFNLDAKIGISLDHFESYQKAYKALELAKEENQPFVTYSQFAINLLKENDEQKCQAIKEAISNKKILPFFQPVFTNENTVLFYESLIRLAGEDGVQSPKFFLEIAHKRGLYTTIIKELSNILKEIKAPKSINLSIKDFEDTMLYEFLLGTYQNSYTIFELQNDIALQQTQDFSLFKALKQNNIKICLDNINNPNELEKYDKGMIDFVKVHGDLIRLLPLHDKEYTLTKEILEKALEINAFPIATHINSQNCFESAKEIGFKAFQGFFFSKPTSTL